MFAPIAIDLDLRVQLPGESAELRAAFEHARTIASYDGSRSLDDAPARRPNKATILLPSRISDGQAGNALLVLRTFIRNRSDCGHFGGAITRDCREAEHCW